MNNLRNLRKKRGLSIKKLHELTGFPVRTLEDWDANKKPIQAYHRIKNLSEVLECSMDEFMTWKEECLWQNNKVYVTMFQEEAGVRFKITLIEDSKYDLAAVISRETALEFLKYLKETKSKEIYPFTRFMNIL